MTEQVGTAKFVRQLFHTSPLSTLLANETEPGTAVASDEQLKTWVLDNCTPQHSRLPLPNKQLT